MRAILLFATASAVAAASAGCTVISYGSTHADKCRITYQSYMPVALPPYDGHVETVVGHPGNIPQCAEMMKKAGRSTYHQARIFNRIRRELTSQLRDDDYALIGWMSAVGTGNCNFVQLEEAMACRAKRWGGDVVLVVSHRVQPKPPFEYIMSCHPRLTFYGHTDYETYAPSPAHGAVARYPQAEAFVLRSCAGINDMTEQILALSAEAYDRYDSRWRAWEAEAAHGEDAQVSLRWLGQGNDNVIVAREVPLPGRKLWWDFAAAGEYSPRSSTWSKFAQRRRALERGLWARQERAGIDERLIVQDVVRRAITGETLRDDQWGRFWLDEQNEWWRLEQHQGVSYVVE
jgi:hypothetical protein